MKCKWAAVLTVDVSKSKAPGWQHFLQVIYCCLEAAEYESLSSAVGGSHSRQLLLGQAVERRESEL